MKTPDPVQCVLDGYGLIRAVHHRETVIAAEAIDGMEFNELRGVLAAVVSFAVMIAEMLAEHCDRDLDGLLDVLVGEL